MARPLAFFYRRTQLSGRIRRQMEGRLDARFNPRGDMSQDICIGVKMSPGLLRHDKLIEKMGDYYLDFIDHHTCLDWLIHWPQTKVIVASRSGETWLREYTRCPLTFIPQHHCNVERQTRPDRPVRVVGYVGMMQWRPAWYDRLQTAVQEMGLEMRWYTDFQDRMDVVRAYQEIDIQFAWRDGMPEKLLYLKNPMRILNAASFGIPTVAKREPSFEAECAGHYHACETFEEALEQIRGLTEGWKNAAQLRALAEPYHIEHVVKAFRRLADA